MAVVRVARTTLTRTDLARLAEASLRATLGGTLDELAPLIHPEAHNRMSVNEPPPTRGLGPAAFYATGEWLRAAFSDLTWTTEAEVVNDGQLPGSDTLVVTYGTMSGRHTGDFVVWTPEGTVERAFAPTGRRFTVAHAHFQRLVDGRVIEHWAVRDDQGMVMQLGWVPPTPGYLLRCSVATWRARRDARGQGGGQDSRPANGDLRRGLVADGRTTSRPGIRLGGVAAAAAVAWAGFFVHNLADLPSQTIASPESLLPTLIWLTLLALWLFPATRRGGARALLVWATVNLIGGALSVLPLAVLPFEPEQSLRHYLFHGVYALSQLPLIALTWPWLRRS